MPVFLNKGTSKRLLSLLFGLRAAGSGYDNDTGTYNIRAQKLAPHKPDKITCSNDSLALML